VKVTSAVLRSVGEPLEPTQLELEGPGHGELLVRMRAAGLCHSDLATMDGTRPRPVPMALGHEGAGEVVALGPGVSEFAVGDHVVLTFVPACGSCVHCAEGRPALCEPGAAANAAGELIAGGRRLTESGSEVHHHLGVSAFSDHVVVSSRSAVAIDPEVPWEIAALFGCAVLTGVGAVVNAARVRPGEAVAVFGLGGVGLAALVGAVAAGAHPIIAVDRVPEKLALAERLGSDHVVPAADDTADRVSELSGGGVDHAIETVGKSAVLAQAYAATRRGGTTTTVGLPHPSEELRIPAVTLTAQEKHLQGSYLGSCVPARDIPRFIAMYRAGKLPIDWLLTDCLAPREINEGFARLARGEGVRQVVLF
jgi:alcohol dehydrogenase